MVATIILAAGKGTRMKSDLPKVLHKLHGVSMIKRVVHLAEDINSDRIIIVVGYKSDMVKKELKDYPHVEFVEQKEQLGTGHAVLQCKELLENYKEEIFVISGDTPALSPQTAKDLIQYFKEENYTEDSNDNIDVTFLSACVPDPSGFGRVVRSMVGTVHKIVEDKDCKEDEKNIKEINTGIYVFNAKSLFKILPHINTNNKQGEYYLTDVVSLTKKPVFCLKAPDYRETLGINTVKQLKQMESFLLLE